MRLVVIWQAKFGLAELEQSLLMFEHLQPTTALHRRRFLKGLATAVGLGLGAGILAACGDNTQPTASSTTVATSTTVTNTTLAPASTKVATSTTVAAVATTAQAATTAAAASGTAPAGYVQVGKVASPDVAPAKFNVGKTKGFIYTKSATQVAVFSNVCTHQGCEVGYSSADKKFVCPCHGSQFSLTGAVVKGPAQLALEPYDAKIVGDTVYAKLPA